MTIENELKDLIINKSKSIRQFANEVDIPATTIQSMLNSGIENAGVKKVMKICDYLGLDTDALADGYIKEKVTNLSGITYSELSHIKKYRNLNSLDKRIIDDTLETMSMRQRSEHAKEFIMFPDNAILKPYYPHIASAGTGQFLFDDIPADLVQVAEQCDMVIGVNGDSMEPTYYDNDMLLVVKQNTVREGEIGIFIINGEAYVKEYQGDRLVSHNKEYSDINLDEHMEIRCLGKVIGNKNRRFTPSI